jgi:hypothetical protein
MHYRSLKVVHLSANDGRSGYPTVAQLMGHRTIQMTTWYAYLAPGHNQSGVDGLASFSWEVVATKSATRVFERSQRAKRKRRTWW